MKEHIYKEKEFDTVKFFREVKEKISEEIWGLSYEELMEYLAKAKQEDIIKKKAKEGWEKSFAQYTSESEDEQLLPDFLDSETNKLLEIEEKRKLRTKKMKERFFIDTSVWGGLFDEEFKQDTAILFDMIKTRQIVCLYSRIVENELIKAPPIVREFFNDFPNEQKEKIAITSEALELAETYISENVVSETSYDDCVHIAVATVHRANLLVSWNFKHIVNIYRMRGYNAINIKFGYPVLNIHSPKDIIGYANEIKY